MPPIVVMPTNSIVNVQVVGLLNQQTIISLFQYRFDGVGNPLTNYTAYFDDLHSILNLPVNLLGRYLDAMPSNYVNTDVRYQPVYPTRLRYYSVGSIGNGAFAGAATTSNVAASIERFSLVNRRHGIGRVQLPIPASVYTNGILDPGAYRVALNALATVIPDQILTVGVGTAGTWDPVILNPNNPNPTLSYIYGALYQTTVRTMHRRTVGLGI